MSGIPLSGGVVASKIGGGALTTDQLLASYGVGGDDAIGEGTRYAGTAGMESTGAGYADIAVGINENYGRRWDIELGVTVPRIFHVAIETEIVSATPLEYLVSGGIALYDDSAVITALELAVPTDTHAPTWADGVHAYGGLRAYEAAVAAQHKLGQCRKEGATAISSSDTNAAPSRGWFIGMCILRDAAPGGALIGTIGHYGAHNHTTNTTPRESEDNTLTLTDGDGVNVCAWLRVRSRATAAAGITCRIHNVLAWASGGAP